MEEVVLLVCGWRDVPNWKKPTTLAIQLKLSRCAEDEEVSAYAVLSNHVKPAKHSKTCEQSREIQSSQHTQSSWNIVLDLNYHENAA